MHNQDISLLYNDNGEYIAYHQLNGKPNTQMPGIIFLSGFMSDMTGTKAVHLSNFCEEQGYPYIRFDYRGRGGASGEFLDGTIGMWLEDTLMVIDRLAEGPQILVGSSMGGWLMLLASLARPGKIAGLVGIAAGPDFTEELVWDKLTIEEKCIIEKEGKIQFTDCSGDFIITHKLIKEARNHLLLNKNIPVTCPVRLLHGMEDEEVPYSTALRIAEKITGDNVQVQLVKNADHRMSSESNLALIAKTVKETVDCYSC